MRTALYLSIFLLLNGCVSYNRCAEKFGTLAKDTVFVNYTDTIFTSAIVPADSSSVVFDMDSLVYGQIYTTDSSTISVQYWIDKYTRLFNIKAKQPEKHIPVSVAVRDTIPCPPAVIFADEKGGVRRFFHKYCVFAGMFLPFVILILFVGLWRKR